ncbi:hypothetical protein GUJ93_ZPchr0001g31221 [Zizania palustris]|uniref:Uncharacterized protein n=1 Tax=Zizania palustris TaxID=103762 RepID=A0A8J5RTJ1_ZIZPA|nr:hypothetical protein GUJ93_ZPchr0001g31221 [Zizania palustris]
MGCLVNESTGQPAQDFSSCEFFHAAAGSKVGEDGGAFLAGSIIQLSVQDCVSKSLLVASNFPTEQQNLCM